MGKERRTTGRRGFTLTLVCCAVVNHYTGAYEMEEMGVWELPGKIPPFPSLSKVKTIRKEGGYVSKHQLFFRLREIIIGQNITILFFLGGGGL